MLILGIPLLFYLICSQLLKSEILFSETTWKRKQKTGRTSQDDEAASSEGFITPHGEKGGNDFGKLFNDTMICSLIKYFILPRFCIS